MRLRPHRRNLVVWSLSAGPADKYGAPTFAHLARTGRIRRWIRTSALLAVIGLMRAAHTMRTRWRLTLLLAGGVLTIVGGMLSSGVVLLPGLLILLMAMLIGSDPAKAFVYNVDGTRLSATVGTPIHCAEQTSRQVNHRGGVPPGHPTAEIRAR
jgi:hypothetical protein